MRLLVFVSLIFIYLNADAQRYGTGLVFNDTHYAKAKVRANLNDQDFELLPTSYSLKKYSPAPGNQLQLNTSPSWATAWSARAILDAQIKEWDDSDAGTPHTYSPSYLYQYVRQIDDETCEAGIELYEALEFLKHSNLKAFDDFQEFCPRNIPNELLPKNDGSAIDYRKLYDSSHSRTFKVNSVKKSISQNLPVVVGMHCPPSFFSASRFWQPTEKPDPSYSGHAICVVGYDDDKYGGSFEILNSWGREWGNNGFLWVRYDDFVDFVPYAFEVFQLTPAAGEYELSGSIELRLNTNENVLLEQVDDGNFRSPEPFITGTHFRIYLKNESPAFVYVFGVDAENNFDKVFPHQDTISPALVYKSNKLALPSEDSYIKIIGNPGQENLYILYSKESVDFEHLISNLSRYPGDLVQNLDALLNGKLLPADEIEWKESGIEFHARSKNRNAIFIRIQINHI